MSSLLWLCQALQEYTQGIHKYKDVKACKEFWFDSLNYLLELLVDFLSLRNTCSLIQLVKIWDWELNDRSSLSRVIGIFFVTDYLFYSIVTSFLWTLTTYPNLSACRLFSTWQQSLAIKVPVDHIFQIKLPTHEKTGL